MDRQEFETLAIKKGRVEIPQQLYDEVEYFYMAENDYHANHGGVDEGKNDFVNRVFGGKVNTLKSIIIKISSEACKENRWALRGNPSATEARLAEMDWAIKMHYQKLCR